MWDLGETYCATFLCRNFLDLVYELHVLVKDIWLESWSHFTEIPFGDVVEAVDLARQEAF